MPRLCVYTALTGRYESFNEQPVAAGSKIPFICLTDDPELRSDSWQVRQAPLLFGMDPGRSQRDFKIRPHLHLPDFDISLYIDNSVLLTEPPERVFERYSLASGICVPWHSFRDSVLDEFMEVSRIGLDDPDRIFEHLDHYASEFPDVLEERPYWTGIMLRDHRDPRLRTMLEIWAAHVYRYSRRDQLSVNAAFRQASLTPEVMDIDNHTSWFHTWPHTEGRDRARAVRVSSPAPRYREMERELTKQAKEQVALLDFPTWRVAALLNKGARRHPHLTRFVWRALKPFF